MPGKLQRAKAERERREAEWLAEQERVHAFGGLFSALHAGAAKDALRLAMRNRIIDLYNRSKFAEGDAILEFLPNKFARQLLDWYFPDEDTSQATEAPTGEDEDSERRQVQSEPQEPVRAHG